MALPRSPRAATGSVLLRQENRGRTSVRFGDDPELGAIGGRAIGRQHPESSPNREFVFRSIRRADFSPVPPYVTRERREHVLVAENRLCSWCDAKATEVEQRAQRFRRLLRALFASWFWKFWRHSAAAQKPFRNGPRVTKAPRLGVCPRPSNVLSR